MAEQYTDFSNAYDLFMDNVPYENWSEEIVEKLRACGIEDGIVLDLGCGTGTLTKLLSDKGYDMIGIDASEDMLMIAREKSDDESGMLFLCQDISDFELYGTVRAVVSTCDTLNYLTEDEDLLNTFKLVNNYLEPDGVFLFDMNAPEKYIDVLADNVIAENREEASFVWENYYDEDTKINEYALTLFLRDEETGLFERTEEFHYQKAYSRERIAELLSEAGLEIVENCEEELRMYYLVKVIAGKKLGNIG